MQWAGADRLVDQVASYSGLVSLGSGLNRPQLAWDWRDAVQWARADQLVDQVASRLGLVPLGNGLSNPQLAWAWRAGLYTCLSLVFCWACKNGLE